MDSHRAIPPAGCADVAGLFLAGARLVAAAIDDPLVAKAWDQPSVLADQRVSSLAGHLARGGGWIVAEYLDAPAPAGPVDFSSAGEYFAAIMSSASPDLHQAIRDRGAATASAGYGELARSLHQRLDALEPRVRAADLRRLVAVVGGKVLRLDDFLVSRIVEQVVHLDDLARSVGRDPWPLPDGAQELTLAVGTEIGCRISGPGAMVRALFRSGFAASALPVL